MADGTFPAPRPRASERLLALLGLPAQEWTQEQEASYQASMTRADTELYELIQRRNRGQNAA